MWKIQYQETTDGVWITLLTTDHKEYARGTFDRYHIGIQGADAIWGPYVSSGYGVRLVYCIKTVKEVGSTIPAPDLYL